MYQCVIDFTIVHIVYFSNPVCELYHDVCNSIAYVQVRDEDNTIYILFIYKYIMYIERVTWSAILSLYFQSILFLLVYTFSISLSVNILFVLTNMLHISCFNWSFKCWITGSVWLKNANWKFWLLVFPKNRE